MSVAYTRSGCSQHTFVFIFRLGSFTLFAGFARVLTKHLRRKTLSSTSLLDENNNFDMIYNQYFVSGQGKRGSLFTLFKVVPRTIKCLIFQNKANTNIKSVEIMEVLMPLYFSWRPSTRLLL
jgi:hypothetical protein